MKKYLLLGGYAIFTLLTTLDAADESYSAPTEHDGVKSRYTVKFVKDPDLGIILTDGFGRTLYTSTADQNGISACDDQCSSTWRPLEASADRISAPSALQGYLGVIKREDGKLQVTYNQKPLYYYEKDTKPGEANGQQKDHQWFVVNPSVN